MASDGGRLSCPARTHVEHALALDRLGQPTDDDPVVQFVHEILGAYLVDSCFGFSLVRMLCVAFVDSPGKHKNEKAEVIRAGH